jgi:hypothetical protein
MGWWQGGATQSLQMALYGLIKKMVRRSQKTLPTTSWLRAGVVSTAWHDKSVVPY